MPRHSVGRCRNQRSLLHNAGQRLWEPSWEPFPVDCCGRLVDASGHRTLSFRAVWTAVDGCGRRLEIYGSEGWGFECLRACHGSPCPARISLLQVCDCCRADARILGDLLVELPRGASDRKFVCRLTSSPMTPQHLRSVTHLGFQIGRRMAGSQGVRGSNPLSSTEDKCGGTSGLAWGSVASGHGT